MVLRKSIQQGRKTGPAQLQRTDFVDHDGPGLLKRGLNPLDGPVERGLTELEPTDRNGDLVIGRMLEGHLIPRRNVHEAPPHR